MYGGPSQYRTILSNWVRYGTYTSRLDSSITPATTRRGFAEHHSSSGCRARSSTGAGLSDVTGAEGTAPTCPGASSLSSDHQVFPRLRAPDAVVGTEVIAVVALVDLDPRLVALHRRHQDVQVGKAVRRVRQHDDAAPEPLEQPLEGGERGATVRERRERLGDLLDFRLREDREPLPVAGQPLEEVVPLH